MELYLIIFLAIIAILLVIILQRLNRSKPSTIDDTKDQELALMRSQKAQLHLDLVRTEQRFESLEAEKNRLVLRHKEDKQQFQQETRDLRDKYMTAEKALESERAYYKAQQKQLQAQKEEVEQIRRQFNLEFQNIATKILDENTQRFTEVNTENLDHILRPLKDKIKRFEDKVEKSYNQEAAERNVLKGVVEQLMEQSNQIRNEANSLARALRGDNKKQGNWGEVILERVLERSGLLKDQEYHLQAALIDADGRRQQPDAIIHLPDDKHLVVDSKVSLVAYERWVNAEDDAERNVYAKQHIQSVENHIKGLSAKNYHELYQINSPDFVLLFMPIESAFSMSMTYKSDLFSDAWDRGVVIVSPSTLLATLRTIASVWKQQRQARNVLEIAKEAGNLYDKFVGFLHDMDRVGDQLDNAQKTHEEARKKLGTGRGNLIRRVEKLKDLGAQTSKQIDPKDLDPDDLFLDESESVS